MRSIFRLFVRFLPPYKKEAAASLFFNILSTVLSLFSFAAIIPVLQILFGLQTSHAEYQVWAWNDGFETVFNAVKNNLFYELNSFLSDIQPTTALIYIGIFLVVMTAFKVGAAYLGAYFIIPIRTGIVRDLRQKMYRKILALPLGYFTEERKGDIMSRTMNDVNEVEASTISSLEMLFKNPVMIVIYLVVLFAMSWQLTLFVLVFLPLGAWLVAKIGKGLKRKSLLGQQQTGELLSELEETLGGLRVIKAFNAEKKVDERFANTSEKIRKTFNRLNRRYNLAHPMSEQIGTVIIAILLWFGGVIILGENSTLGAEEFIYYLAIFYSVIAPAKDLSRAAYSIQKGKASLERIDQILNSENNIREPEKPAVIEDFNVKIEFRNASFRYGNEWVLENINLTIEKGKTVAFVGQSGSGKSTLVDLLPRFYDVQQGEILIDGINIKDVNTHALRRLFGIVNQEAILFNDTFFNNIAFGIETATQEKVEAAARIANADEFIEASENGYQSSIGERGCKLSGGQRQRISIARAVLKNPPILILDEATSALDTESERLVQDALDNLMKNRTTLVVAHRLSTIKNADEICVLHEGKIVERGKHDELIAANGYYKRLVDMQKF